jgi:hypothetical protein
MGHVLRGFAARCAAVALPAVSGRSFPGLCRWFGLRTFQICSAKGHTRGKAPKVEKGALTVGQSLHRTSGGEAA